MCLLQCLHSFVVGLELGKLLSVLLDPAVEASFQFCYLATEVGNFALVVGFQGLFLRQQALFVLHKLVLALLFGLNVLLLERPDLVLPRFTFLSTLERLFLPVDDPVGTVEKSFNFFLVSVLNGDLHCAILLVLAVQVEDHLGQLGDLLRHLVVRFFVHSHFTALCSIRLLFRDLSVQRWLASSF